MTLLENFCVDSDATCPSGAEHSMYVSSLETNRRAQHAKNTVDVKGHIQHTTNAQLNTSLENIVDGKE